MLKELNPEVLVADAPIVTLTRDDVASLKARAAGNRRRRARICAHRGVDAAVHEMLIVMARGCYIRPHKHVGKSESFHLVEGELDIVVFDDDGRVTAVLPLGDYASGRSFYYRADSAVYHTVIIRTAVAVIHETTNGPFDPSGSSFAPWAPDEQDVAGVAAFVASLGAAVAAHLESKPR